VGAAGSVDLALIAYLHLPLPELIGCCRRPAEPCAGRPAVLRRACPDQSGARFGGPADPGVLTEIADLARRGGFAVAGIVHCCAPPRPVNAIDILLDATPWTSRSPT